MFDDMYNRFYAILLDGRAEMVKQHRAVCVLRMLTRDKTVVYRLAVVGM